MVDLLLYRFSSHTDSTIGALFRKENSLSFRCFTLEDEAREIKIPGETRIPAGRYEIRYRTVGGMHERYSRRFSWHKGMLWLQDVPGFEWIYLHPGSSDDDTDGCILVGDKVQQNLTKPGRLSDSVASYERLYAEIAPILDRGESVYLDVRDFA